MIYNVFVLLGKRDGNRNQISTDAAHMFECTQFSTSKDDEGVRLMGYNEDALMFNWCFTNDEWFHMSVYCGNQIVAEFGEAAKLNLFEKVDSAS